LLYDRQLGKSRPIGVFEGRAWATVNLKGHADLFIGHPVLVDNPQLFVQVTQSGEDRWTIEIHNPTDAPITTRIRPNSAFGPFKSLHFPAGSISVRPGISVVMKFPNDNANK